MHAQEGRTRLEGSVGRAERNRLGLERLVYFSDAAFATGMTPLFLDPHLPADINADWMVFTTVSHQEEI